MKKNIQNVIIGTLFIVAMSIMTNYALSDKKITKSNTYFAVFNDADGIHPNTKIYMTGIPVGIVTGITLKNGNVQMELSIKEDIAIPSDSMLKIETFDFQAPKTLSISPGFEENILQKNDFFESVQNSVDFMSLINSYLDGRIAKEKAKEAKEAKEKRKKNES